MDRADEKYKTAKAFRVAITTRLKTLARTTGEPYPELYRRVAIDRFLARIDWSKWTAKGGYILQRRLPKARATKDIDLSTADTSFMIQDEKAQAAALTAAFQETAKVDTGDYFTFQIAVEKPLPGFGKGGIRCNVRCLLDGEQFATFQLDAIIQDEVVFPPENIEGDKFLSFAGLKPLTLKVPAKEEVFAEKHHAYTLPRDKENTRVKDMLDLALLLQDGVDKDMVKEAIGGVFSIRKTHDVPADLPVPPESWQKVFAELAKDGGIDLTLDDAFKMVTEFYASLNLKTGLVKADPEALARSSVYYDTDDS
jgi:Nucleotidyl transferase AbiEii toxin, Type IV TA system